MLEDLIMNLARSSYWQNAYKASKECGSVSLFENHSQLSAIQSDFLYWLRAFEICYDDLYSKAYPFLSDKYLKDNDRVKAYLYFRKHNAQQKDQSSGYKDDNKEVSPIKMEIIRPNKKILK